MIIFKLLKPSRLKTEQIWPAGAEQALGKKGCDVNKVMPYYHFDAKTVISSPVYWFEFPCERIRVDF